MNSATGTDRFSARLPPASQSTALVAPVLAVVVAVLVAPRAVASAVRS